MYRVFDIKTGNIVGRYPRIYEAENFKYSREGLMIAMPDQNIVRKSQLNKVNFSSKLWDSFEDCDYCAIGFSDWILTDDEEFEE
jgi:hypothetical protein